MILSFLFLRIYLLEEGSFAVLRRAQSATADVRAALLPIP